MTPELHRPFVPEAIPPGGQTVEIIADPAECIALAERMRLPAIAQFGCCFRLTSGFGGIIEAAGRLRAKITQTCVVTLDDFAAVLDERFALRFVPAGRETFDADPEAVDEIPYDTGSIDLGEAAAEQLALVLDPYPRKPGVALPEVDDSTAEQTPFAALAALKFPRRPD